VQQQDQREPGPNRRIAVRLRHHGDASEQTMVLDGVRPGYARREEQGVPAPAIGAFLAPPMSLSLAQTAAGPTQTLIMYRWRVWDRIRKGMIAARYLTTEEQIRERYERYEVIPDVMRTSVSVSST
jgi:hypothetical protein